MIVAFIDFDYFFAQVEEVLNPSLRGKPVVVCVYSGRSESSGAVATCNYEARRLGIRSGMPISSALKLGKDKAVFLPMKKEVYKRFSDEIMNLLRKYADSLEVASIDEAFLDITNRVSNYEQAESLAISMKREILERTQIKTTVGIAPNKVLAKMAAEQAKPNGLKVVSPERVNEFLSQVKLINVPGIGEVIADKLNKLGVRSLNDVLKADPVKMREALGESRYFYLLRIARNTYEEPVKERERRSFVRIVTLPENSHKVRTILPSLMRAIDEAYAKIDGLPMNISLIAIMEDLDTLTRTKDLKRGITKEQAYEIVEQLLHDLLREDSRALRRVGVKLSKITRISGLDHFLHI